MNILVVDTNWSVVGKDCVLGMGHGTGKVQKSWCALEIRAEISWVCEYKIVLDRRKEERRQAVVSPHQAGRGISTPAQKLRPLPPLASGS